MNRIEINAVIENIVFSNPDNGFVICEVDSKEEGQFCAVGYMPSIAEGETSSSRLSCTPQSCRQTKAQ